MKAVFFLICYTFVSSAICQEKIANYISNGSFEASYTCTPGNIVNKANSWRGLGNDSTQIGGTLYEAACYSNMPVSISGYQIPFDGKAYCKISPYCSNFCFYPILRIYPCNRLKATLGFGQTYCVKMHLSLTNMSPRAINKLGFFFGDNSLDTINYPFLPLTYLNPQIESNTIYSDTLNWSTLSGTFTANGTEKYLVIGNFKSDAQTTTSITLPNSAEDWAEYFIDAVSCIPVNVPAYAGGTKWITPGDSVYLGRESDFAIDPFCIWYQLPNMTTAIDTTSGIWVKPSSTSTYVVKQNLECGSLKWDTVVVYLNPLNVQQIRGFEKSLAIFPQPANESFSIKITGYSIGNFFVRYEIYDSNLKILKLAAISNSITDLEIDTSNLPSGIYSIRLIQAEKGMSIGRKFVVLRN